MKQYFVDDSVDELSWDSVISIEHLEQDLTYQKYLNCIQKFMANPEQNQNHYKNVANKILKHLKKNRVSLF